MNKNNRLQKGLSQDLPCLRPNSIQLDGRYVRLAPLSAKQHGAVIHRLNGSDDDLWTHMAYGPFADEAAYCDWVQGVENGEDPVYLAIYDQDGVGWAGVASYLRINTLMRVIEVGNICFSPALQQRRAATEAMYLMMKWAFDSGYRRYEWKCNALNMPSRRAAQRLGFSYEGIFRQHMIVKGSNRDTAWFSIIDQDWPGLQGAFETWLAPENFDGDGQQKISLSTLTAGSVAMHDPDL